jgi:hypothetical protein
MSSSGVLRHVSLVRTDVSEQHIASIIRVTIIGELGTTLVVTTNRSKLRRITLSNDSVRVYEVSELKETRYGVMVPTYKEERKGRR